MANKTIQDRVIESGLYLSLYFFVLRFLEYLNYAATLIRLWNFRTK